MWRRLARSSAAVARRVDASRPHSRAPLCLPFPPYAPASIREFSSTFNAPSGAHQARVDDVKVREVQLSELVRRPWVQLQEQYGFAEMSKVRQTLPLLWKDLASKSAEGVEVPLEIVRDFYEIARLRRLVKLQDEVFSYLQIHYNDRVSFEMYGQMFTSLVTTKNPKRMRDVFQRAMDRYDHEQGQTPPEVVYRLGITAAISLEDYSEMKTLLRGMEANGVKPSIEIVSRVMVAQAKMGDVRTVVAAAERLDPEDDQKWHEADVNRVITSLGIAGEPDAAFDFYRRSHIRLSPQTLMKLMLVCRGNSRSKHALAILANRRRFGMKMQPAQYPMLLEIIEELGIAGEPANELALTLKEMREDKVMFNERVHALIARNQHHLRGTPFMLTPTMSESSGLGQEEGEVQTRTKEADKPLLRELLDNRKFAEAAAIVDMYMYALPVSTSSPAESADDEATTVPAWLADLAVEAYSHNQELDKVRSLLRGFMCVRGNVRQALSRIVGLFGGKGKLRDSRVTYEAFLAMQFQGLHIFRIQDAIARFKEYQDANAALELFKQVSGHIAEALQGTDILDSAARDQEDFMQILKKSNTLHFDPGRTVRDMLRIFLELKEQGMIKIALDQLELDGIPVRAVEYDNIFAAMSKHNSDEFEVFTADDFMMVYDDMVQRNVMPNKAVLRLAIPELCKEGGDVDSDEMKRRQLAVIEGYHQALTNRRDKYVLPTSCFTTLMETAAKVGSAQDVEVVHAGAVKSMSATMNKKNNSVGDHSKLLEKWNAIKSEKLADEEAARS